MGGLWEGYGRDMGGIKNISPMPKPAVHAGFERLWEGWIDFLRKPDFFCEDAKNG
jgi:hypothetical protein